MPKDKPLCSTALKPMCGNGIKTKNNYQVQVSPENHTVNLKLVIRKRYIYKNSQVCANELCVQILSGQVIRLFLIFSTGKKGHLTGNIIL
jgi:hypothetical protein